MFSELISNLSILLGLTLLSTYLRGMISPYKITGKIALGFLVGLAVIIGMEFPFTFSQGLIFDGRSVIISISAFFFGPITTIVTALISTIYRIYIGGPGQYMGVSVIIASAGIGLVFYYLRIKKIMPLGIISFFFLGLIVHFVMILLMKLLPMEISKDVFVKLTPMILLIYIPFTIIFGYTLNDQEKRKLNYFSIKRSEEEFRSIFNLAPTGILLFDVYGKFLRVNKSLLDMLGYSELEFLSLTIDKITHPYDISFSKEMINKLINNEISIANFEKRYLHKSGDVIWGNARIIVIRDLDGNPLHLITHFQDITKQKQNEEHHVALSRILEDSQNEIYIFSAENLKFIEVNKGARNNIGYSIEELREMTPLDIKPNFTLESFNKLISDLLTKKKEKIVFETVHRRKDGTDYLVEIHLQLQVFESKAIFVAIIIDITTRKRSEEELLSLKNDLEIKVIEKTKELQERLSELQLFHDIAVDREIRMEELKAEIKRLKGGG